MRFGSDTKLEALAAVPLFASCSPSQLRRIARIADEIDFRPGRVLAKEGSRGHEFFVLLEGTADVRRDTRLLPPLGPGDFFGEISLVTDKARTATVTALSPLRALVINRAAFRGLLRAFPQIQGKILEAVAERLAASL